MNRYIDEKDINEVKIKHAIGNASYGDEDFAIFKCPQCNKIYLIDYEVDTIYLSAKNIQLMTSASNFSCIKCGYSFAGKIIIGNKADDIFKVTNTEIIKDDWAWIIK